MVGERPQIFHEEHEMNKVFQALAHKDRREVLRLIKRSGEMNAGELSEHFDFSKPTLSHHLKALSDAELLVRERRGQFIYYQINQSVFEEVLGVMFELFEVDQEDAAATHVGDPEEVSS